MAKCKECGVEVSSLKVNDDLFCYCSFCLNKKLGGFLQVKKLEDKLNKKLKGG